MNNGLVNRLKGLFKTRKSEPALDVNTGLSAGSVSYKSLTTVFTQGGYQLTLPAYALPFYERHHQDRQQGRPSHLEGANWNHFSSEQDPDGLAAMIQRSEGAQEVQSVLSPSLAHPLATPTPLRRPTVPENMNDGVEALGAASYAELDHQKDLSGSALYLIEEDARSEDALPSVSAPEGLLPKDPLSSVSAPEGLLLKDPSSDDRTNSGETTISSISTDDNSVSAYCTTIKVFDYALSATSDSTDSEVASMVPLSEFTSVGSTSELNGSRMMNDVEEVLHDASSSVGPTAELTSVSVGPTSELNGSRMMNDVEEVLDDASSSVDPTAELTPVSVDPTSELTASGLTFFSMGSTSESTESLTMNDVEEVLDDASSSVDPTSELTASGLTFFSMGSTSESTSVSPTSELTASGLTSVSVGLTPEFTSVSPTSELTASGLTSVSVGLTSELTASGLTFFSIGSTSESTESTTMNDVEEDFNDAASFVSVASGFAESYKLSDVDEVLSSAAGDETERVIHTLPSSVVETQKVVDASSSAVSAVNKAFDASSHVVSILDHILKDPYTLKGGGLCGIVIGVNLIQRSLLNLRGAVFGLLDGSSRSLTEIGNLFTANRVDTIRESSLVLRSFKQDGHRLLKSLDGLIDTSCCVHGEVRDLTLISSNVLQDVNCLITEEPDCLKSHEAASLLRGGQEVALLISQVLSEVEKITKIAPYARVVFEDDFRDIVFHADVEKVANASSDSISEIKKVADALCSAISKIDAIIQTSSGLVPMIKDTLEKPEEKPDVLKDGYLSSVLGVINRVQHLSSKTLNELTEVLDASSDVLDLLLGIAGSLHSFKEAQTLIPEKIDGIGIALSCLKGDVCDVVLVTSNILEKVNTLLKMAPYRLKDQDALLLLRKVQDVALDASCVMSEVDKIARILSYARIVFEDDWDSLQDSLVAPVVAIPEADSTVNTGDVAGNMPLDVDHSNSSDLLSPEGVVDDSHYADVLMWMEGKRQAL